MFLDDNADYILTRSFLGARVTNTNPLATINSGSSWQNTIILRKYLKSEHINTITLTKKTFIHPDFDLKPRRTSIRKKYLKIIFLLYYGFKQNGINLSCDFPASHSTMSGSRSSKELRCKMEPSRVRSEKGKNGLSFSLE